MYVIIQKIYTVHYAKYILISKIKKKEKYKGKIKFFYITKQVST